MSFNLSKKFIIRAAIIIPLLLIFFLTPIGAPGRDFFKRHSSDAYYETLRMKKPLYRFIAQVNRVTPPRDSVFFLDAWLYGHEARYYLYPRNFIKVEDRELKSPLRELMPKEPPPYLIIPQSRINEVEALGGYRLVFSAEQWALYRASREGGKTP